MKNQEPPKSTQEKINELLKNEDLSDEQFEDQLRKICGDEETKNPEGSGS